MKLKIYSAGLAGGFGSLATPLPWEVTASMLCLLTAGAVARVIWGVTV